MRLIRIAVLLVLLSVPLVVTSSASALDLCEEPQCQPPAAEQNTPYEFEFEAEEGCVPYRFTFLNGNLPPGLQVTQDGRLIGTPTVAGAFDFWVALDDNGGPGNPACLVKGEQSQAHFFMTVLPDLAVTTESLPAAVPGVAYQAQLQFSSPEFGWPVVWDITQGALPQGLTLSQSGLISGTPAGPDTKTFTVRAREPFRRFGERQLTLTVATALQARAATRTGEVGVRYTGAIRATGGARPLSWSVTSGSLPAGLSLNPATGVIAGVPRRAGAFALTVTVTDAAGQRATVPASMRIAARLAIATSRLPSAATGEAYRFTLRARGGLGAKQWRHVGGSLPRGLRLNRATGTLSGSPLDPGVYRLRVQVTDRLGGRSTRLLRLVVTG